ncbi:hypothetical protein LINPERPRIM_LOCUS34030 [Linum perenne]
MPGLCDSYRDKLHFLGALDDSCSCWQEQVRIRRWFHPDADADRTHFSVLDKEQLIPLELDTEERLTFDCTKHLVDGVSS